MEALPPPPGTLVQIRPFPNRWWFHIYVGPNIHSKVWSSVFQEKAPSGAGAVRQSDWAWGAHRGFRSSMSICGALWTLYLGNRPTSSFGLVHKKETQKRANYQLPKLLELLSWWKMQFPTENASLRNEQVYISKEEKTLKSVTSLRQNHLFQIWAFVPWSESCTLIEGCNLWPTYSGQICVCEKKQKSDLCP